MTTRASALGAVGNEQQVWDLVVIGGGATGLGTAVEAASRGLKVVLIERSDFAKGTSSRSTKLVHGGVRYLAQMNVNLVLDALRERGRMLQNAPHLVRNFSFVVPTYDWFGLPYYAAGLKIYELLSGKLSLGASKVLSAKRTREMLPGVLADGLRGGVLYHDGQFDDARYAIALMRTLQDLGGIALNYVEAAGLLHESGKVSGVRARDVETGTEFDLRARAVVNATGVFTEEVLRMDEGSKRESLLAVSQGSHMVLPRAFLPGDAALMIPKTSDGRVLFAIPWHEAVIVGTTDEGVPGSSVEPLAMQSEQSFLMEYIGRFLGRRPAATEVLSLWSGLRPLIRAGSGKTSKLSRDHTILISPSGLVTVAGGKWTTYRKMGEDAVNRVCEQHGLKADASNTANLHLHGWTDKADDSKWSAVYGSELPALQALAAADASLAGPLHARLPYTRAEVVWAARNEMARTVEDVLARRTRALFLDARAATEAAPEVSRILGAELGWSEAARQSDLERFNSVAQGYVYQEA